MINQLGYKLQRLLPLKREAKLLFHSKLAEACMTRPRPLKLVNQADKFNSTDRTASGTPAQILPSRTEGGGELIVGHLES